MQHVPARFTIDLKQNQVFSKRRSNFIRKVSLSCAILFIGDTFSWKKVGKIEVRKFPFNADRSWKVINAVLGHEKLSNFGSNFPTSFFPMSFRTSNFPISRFFPTALSNLMYRINCISLAGL